jgi:ABC-type transport system involved in multi-copper enzyme maturation permease subunit
MTEATPGSLSTVWTLAAITLRRLLRGKALWIGLLIALLPVIFGIAVRGGRFHAKPDDVFTIQVLLLAILPPMLAGAPLGEELENRTSAYLWSRPIARWALVAGKLCALAPIVVVLLVAGWSIAIEVAMQTPPTGANLIALAAAGIAASLVAAGIATVVPRFAMVLSIGYMLVDLFIGGLPFSVDALSITWHARAMAGLASGLPGPVFASPTIALALIAGVWTAIGLLRIRRLEV